MFLKFINNLGTTNDSDNRPISCHYIINSSNELANEFKNPPHLRGGKGHLKSLRDMREVLGWKEQRK